ncbi:MAG TPA: hypothetical protein VHF06_14480 [Pseudonocardiaceae bacterium]|jgi:hypothetical protein|nr:hypothetical protein [Pseudonocardiaceae bacterium]
MRTQQHHVSGPDHGLTAPDIAQIWQLPLGTVYQLANQHGWQRFRRSGRMHYSTRDVLQVLD